MTCKFLTIIHSHSRNYNISSSASITRDPGSGTVLTLSPDNAINYHTSSVTCATVASSPNQDAPALAAAAAATKRLFGFRTCFASLRPNFRIINSSPGGEGGKEGLRQSFLEPDSRMTNVVPQILPEHNAHNLICRSYESIRISNTKNRK